MTAEERDKEIEWLTGSIQRSANMGKGINILLIVIAIVMIALAILFTFILNDDVEHEQAPLLFWGLGGLFLLSALVSYVSHKKIVNAETPEKLLAAYDRMWISQSALLVLGAVCWVLFIDGSIFTKTCLVLGIALIALTGWLSMQSKLRLWVAVGLLIAEGILLYFSGIELLEGLPLMIIMVAIMQGEQSLFGNNRDDVEGLDQEDEKDIKKLRELVKERELH